MLFVIAFAVVFFLCLLRVFQLIINRPRTSIKKPSFNYVFGTPGSGKTTFLAWIARLCAKDHKRIYTNVRSLSVTGADIVYIDKNQIGTYDISDGVLLLDEASIDYNNRLMRMTHKEIEFFKYHRHYNLTVYIFSQSWDDADVTLRRLATNYFLVRKSFLYFLNKHIVVKAIRKVLFIKEDDRQIVDGYEFKKLGKYVFPAKKVFGCFNSFDRKPLQPF